MEVPKIASARSMKTQVEKGVTYFWCACGLSNQQPFCDGSHKGTVFSPQKYVAEETKVVGFCGCKHTKNGPLCDGSHKQLTSE